MTVSLKMDIDTFNAIADQVADRYWEDALKDGDAGLIYYIGRVYYDGEGVEKDAEEAADWWLKAAEKGHVEAQYWVAKMFEGEGFNRDIDEAVKWYKKAADEGQHAAAHAALIRGFKK